MCKKNNKRKIYLSLFLVMALFSVGFSNVNYSSYAERSTTLTKKNILDLLRSLVKFITIVLKQVKS